MPEHDIITHRKLVSTSMGAAARAASAFRYWEAKDEDDDLDAEIASKSRKGYPRDNIIFSDDVTAVLIQDGIEVSRLPMDDVDATFG